MTLADAKNLSTHLAFVQRLARGLLGADAADGDDVAQEAMVRAWQKAPADCRDLRGWLTTVIDRLAHNQRRSTLRRRSHERRAAPVASVPAVDDIVAREEVRARVVAAVLGLPPALRDVVLLRYYEGLDSNAIAAVVGVAPSTVRTRMQDGLQRLRARLDDEHGARAAWAVPLAAWQTRMTATPLAEPVLRVALGWRAVVAAVALALLLVPLLLLRDDATPAPAPDPRLVSAAGAERDGADTLVDTTSSRVAIVADPTPVVDDVAPQLRGRVVAAATGRAIAGARVQLEHRPGDEFSILDGQQASRRQRLAELVTDDDGRFAFAVARARQYRLEVTANGFPKHVATNATGGSEVLVALREAAGLRGTVTRSGGGPVGGAVVRLHALDRSEVLATTTTAADGSLWLGDLPPVAVFVDAAAPGCAQAHQQLTLHPGEVAQLELALAVGRTVRGHVHDAASGLPVAGALVSPSWTGHDGVRSDAEGAFAIDGLGEQEELHVRCRGYVAAFALVPTQVDAPRVDFALVRGATVVGRVVDTAGDGLGDAFVAAARDVQLRSGVVHTAWCSATVDADGRFVVEDVGPEQDLQFTVRCPGYGARTVAPGVALLPGLVRDLGSIELRAEALLEGVVVDLDGRAVGGADVHLFGRDRDFAAVLPPGDESLPLFPFAHRHTRTAADGAFRLAGLAAGDYELSIIGAGKQWSVEQVVAGLQHGELRTGLRVVVDVGRTLSGHVRLPGGAPLPSDCRMALVAQRGGEPLHWAKVAADGGFVFEQLPGTGYRISAVDVPAGLAMPAVVDVQTGLEELTLDLVHAERVEGRVVDVQDRPLRGVAVTFWPTGAAVAKPCGTDATGTFCIEAAPGVLGRLVASDPDDPLRTVTRPDVRAGDRGIVLRLP
ncbi:MAG: sigma-70 family RNA polymerase sigma factor [Planctomycetota bacterium]